MGKTDRSRKIQQGVNVLVAGLGLHIISILGFLVLYYWFMSRVHRNSEFLDPRFSVVYLSAKFKTALLCKLKPTSCPRSRGLCMMNLSITQHLLTLFATGTQVALLLILARTAARMVQLSSGLDSSISQSQVYIVVLDGALVLLAAVLLTIFTPGSAFGRAWGMTSPIKKKARRHLSALHPAQRSPGSPLLVLRESPANSPYGYQQRYPYATLPNSKEPRSPPPSATTDTSSSVQGGMRRYTHKRQAPAQLIHDAEPPPYERPLSNIARVPFFPPRALTLSQQYGQGTIVESEVVVAPGGDGGRTGGTGSGGGSGGYSARTRTRSSPRVYEEALVRHDALW